MISLEQYRAMVNVTNCPNCNEPLPQSLDHYPHEWGWPVDGFSFTQWLSLKCLRCDEEWALWKLGVPRPGQVAINGGDSHA